MTERDPNAVGGKFEDMPADYAQALLDAFGEMDWPDIPDTPEQRALIAAHNAEMLRKHPNLRSIYPPYETMQEKHHRLNAEGWGGGNSE